MSLLHYNLLTNSHPRFCCFYLTQTHLKNSTSSLPFTSKSFKTLVHSQTPNNHFLNLLNSKRTFNYSWPLKALESDGTAMRESSGSDEFSFDAFLSLSEFLCLASSAVISIGFAVNSVLPGPQRPILGWLGNRMLVWQCVLLIGGVVMGSVIRRRQFRRICVDFSKPGGSRVNLLGRIEKLEEDLRSSVTIVRALSRQLEKLGIRFRVTRKALKDPVAETAALTQKNYEATRALAMQEDILEKELGEIQKVLLAMQEQQQKQLELILAICKTRKFWESKKEQNQDPDTTEKRNSVVDSVPRMGTNDIQSLAGQKETSSDRT